MYAGYIIISFSYSRNDSNKIVKKFRNCDLSDYKSFAKACKKFTFSCLFQRNIVWVGSPHSSQSNISGRSLWEVTGYRRVIASSLPLSLTTLWEILLPSLSNVSDYVTHIWRKHADLDRNKVTRWEEVAQCD